MSEQPTIFADVVSIRSASRFVRAAADEVGATAYSTAFAVVPSMPVVSALETRGSLLRIGWNLRSLAADLEHEAGRLEHAAHLFEESQRPVSDPATTGGHGTLADLARLTVADDLLASAWDALGSTARSVGSLIHGVSLLGLALGVPIRTDAHRFQPTIGNTSLTHPPSMRNPPAAPRDEQLFLEQTRRNAISVGRRVPVDGEQCLVYAQARGKFGIAGGNEGAFNLLYQGNDARIQPGTTPRATAQLKPQLRGLHGATDFTSLGIGAGDAIVWDSVTNDLKGGFSKQYGHIAVVEAVWKDQILVTEANWDGKGRWHWYKREQLDQTGVYVLPKLT